MPQVGDGGRSRWNPALIITVRGKSSRVRGMSLGDDGGGSKCSNRLDRLGYGGGSIKRIRSIHELL